MEEEPTVTKQLDKKRVFLSRIKRKIFKHVLVLRILIVILLVATTVLLTYGTYALVKKSFLGEYLTLASNFIRTPAGSINSYQDRVNFLVLGKGGKGHIAPDLTDTIMFVSVPLNENAGGTILVSLPRDIWVGDLRTKLNSVYYWGNKKTDGGGLILSKSVVEEIVGQPVHYAFTVDFSVFKGVVDVLGGIEVDVEKSFVDDKYPIAGKENDDCGGDPEFKCRYETVKFDSGKTHMNGETALKFVRSRNAQGDEGTDLARAARQEKIVGAIKNKILSREILFSPKKLFQLYKLAVDSVETDITPPSAATLARLVVNSKDSIKTEVLSENFLENPYPGPKYDNLYVFIPKDGSWKKVQEWFSCLMQKDSDKCKS